jgi:5,5'-dehydrodivanillate O-demethylase
MLAAENELLTRIGPDTPMGGLLRRHWMPIAGVSEFKKIRIKALRLLGENLVLYKDLNGTFGLVDRACAHRRADLSYGFVEKCGLRCNYHGWAYDETGQCVEMPYEDTVVPQTKYKSRVKITAYPVGLSRPATCPGTPRLGTVQLAEWLHANHHFGNSLQLAAVPGKLHRSDSF